MAIDVTSAFYWTPTSVCMIFASHTWVYYFLYSLDPKRLKFQLVENKSAYLLPGVGADRILFRNLRIIKTFAGSGVFSIFLEIENL